MTIVAASTLIGALLAISFQRFIGTIPLWAPVLLPLMIMVLIVALAKKRSRPSMPGNHIGKTLELESIYAHAPLALCSFSNELRITRANHAMANLFSCAVDSMIGKTLDECAPHFAPLWIPHLQAVLKNETECPYLEFNGAPTIAADAFRVWGASFFPIVNDGAGIRGISVVAEERTQERRLAQEHSAHQAILDLAATLAPLDAISESLASSLEKMFPGSLCYVVRANEHDKGVTPYQRSSISWLRELFAPSAGSLNSHDLLSRFFNPPQEWIIPDVSQEPGCEFCHRMQRIGIRSCWIKPIILSNGAMWGACILNHTAIALTLNDAEKNQLDVLVRLVAAVIERHVLHERLVATAERFECAERAGKIGVFDWNPLNGTIVWSRQMEVLFGLSPGAFEGNFSHWRRLIYADDASNVLESIKRLIAHRESWFVIEYRFTCHPTNDIRWMEVQGSVTYDSKGSPSRGVGVAIDITERKHVKERARRDQERLNLALEAGALGFWDWHIPTGAVQFGGSWATMLGYSLEELEPLVDSWVRLVHPDDLAEAQAALERHFHRETPIYECEHRLKKSDGSWTWVLARGRVVEWDSLGKPIRAIGIHADINDQRAARELLKESAKRKDEFLATLAHELRNPLAPIRTGLRIIQHDPGGARGAQAREMMERQVNHMVRLVDDLLDVARITRGQLELKKERASIQDIIRLAVECSMPAISAGGQRLHQNIPKDPIPVYGDVTRLAQLVSNLLVNAAKYTPAGGDISLSARTEGSRTLICVADTGVGIPPEMLNSVFEMFSQVNRTLDRSQGGLGIGLALARKIVEMHAGQIRAESTGTGKGSTFIVELPQIMQERGPVSTNNASEVTNKEGHMKSVFIIDDNVDGAASLGMYLEMLGHQVSIFHSGPEALERMRQGFPDVIFLDIGLPGMTGYEVAKTIRSMPHGSEPLIAAVTGWGTDEDKRKTAAAGCSIHLTKPIDLVEVERLVA